MNLDIKLNLNINIKTAQIQIKQIKLPASALSSPPRKLRESFWFRTKYADFSRCVKWEWNENSEGLFELNKMFPLGWVLILWSKYKFPLGLPFWKLLPGIIYLFLYRSCGKSFWRLTFFCVFLEKIWMASFSGLSCMHLASRLDLSEPKGSLALWKGHWLESQDSPSSALAHLWPTLGGPPWGTWGAWRSPRPLAAMPV